MTARHETVSMTDWDEYQIQSQAPGEKTWHSDLGPHVESAEHGALRISRALEHPEGTGRHPGATGYTYRIIRRHCTMTEGPWEVIPTPPTEGGES